MTILAIETSCDDTCIALIKTSGNLPSLKLRRARKRFDFKILSDIVSSQVEIHRKWGGVYPTLAKREHQKNLPVVLEKVLKKAKNPKINLITVTIGPGLDPCLWVGVNFAKALSADWNLPIVPVNHIEAHILANFINGAEFSSPAVCLVVSGGHTQLILMKDFGKYKILGETRDDAAGECFDKVAKILGLGYPGGPVVAAEAAKVRSTKYENLHLPRPMIKQKNYDFSFSGLKTAVLYNFKSQSLKTRKSKKYIKEMCSETQQAIIDVLIRKTIRAARAYRAKTIILGGGVSANNELRKQFKAKVNSLKPKVNFLVPPKNLCTDNAVMTAVTGHFRWKKMKKAEKWQDIKADANLKIC